ncbi:MAG: radical SAM protein, partial [Deltaproteobacteria bacterium]|nr:radical SAM protein [Deltaproteobacteria bacterium]
MSARRPDSASDAEARSTTERSASAPTTTPVTNRPSSPRLVRAIASGEAIPNGITACGAVQAVANTPDSTSPQRSARPLRSCPSVANSPPRGTLQARLRCGGEMGKAEPLERDTPWSWLRDTVRLGGPGQCVFAINNACNAGCDFCNFALGRLPREDWKYVPLEAARQAIDVLHRNFIRYLVITGGEPMLHPDVEEIIAHARDRSMSVLLVTNGSKLNERSCRALAEAGTTNVIISIDAPTAEAHEGNRGLPKVCERIRKANALFRELGVQVTASVTMSRLVTSYDDLARFLEDLGFDNVTFSYPLTHLDSSFLGFRSSSLVAFGREELLEQFEQVKALKS